MKLKILAVVALAAVGVAAVVYTVGGSSTDAASATDYLTSAATTGDVTDDVAATGTLAPQAQYGVVFGADPYLITADGSAPTSTTTWPVTEVKVAVGDAVAQGDVLAVADTADLRRELAAAQNDLDSANVNLRVAKTSLSDAKDADNTAQIRQAKIGLNSAQNQLADAKLKVAELKAQIQDATITAPVAGTVTAVDITPGFDAPSGAAIVVDSAGFQITTDVVESDLADIKVGQTAAVTVDAVDASFDGVVASISPVAGADSSSGVVTYPVVVTIADAPATLRSGMSADVTITVANAANVLTVPAAALNGSDGDYSVLVLGADGVPVVQAVEVGLVTESSAEITSGLAEGQQVVTGTASDLAGSNTTGGFGGGGFPGGGQVTRGLGGGGNFPGGGPGGN